MKKIIAGLTLTLTLTILTAITSVEAQTIPVYFDNFPMTLSQNPVVQNGTTLVPFRSIFEILDFDVEWNPTTNTITAKKGDVSISLKMGSTTAVVNGENKKLSVAPKMVNGTTMVPLRFVSEAAGYDVNWNDETRYITIGETDKDLINVFERSSVIPLSSGGQFVRCEDLYTVDGTGKFAGYKKLLGHPYVGYDIYYKGNSNSFETTVNENNAKLNEIVKWTYDGKTYQARRGDVYDYLDGVSSLPGMGTYINSDKVKRAFGQTYYDWFNSKLVDQDALYIVEQYLDNLNGNLFEYYYSEYESRKESKESEERYKKEKEAEEAAEAKKAKATEEAVRYAMEEAARRQEVLQAKKDEEEKLKQEYNNKEDGIEQQYKNEWISKRRLYDEYGINAFWLGNTIEISNKKGDKFIITGSPTSQLVDGVIYEGNGIHYQYLKSITYPFPEAKDGSGVYTIKVNDMVFSTSDLRRAGII